MKFLIALLLGISAPAYAGDMIQADAVSPSSAAATYVNKAGDTMTGRLTAPDATLTYGLTAATGSFSGSVTASNSQNATTGIEVNNATSGSSARSRVLATAGPATAVDAGMAAYPKGYSAIPYYSSGNGANGSAVFYGGAVPGQHLIINSYAANSSSIAFATGGFAASNERMTITSGGNIGIGTSSPATTLDVNGNAQFGSGATKSTFTATGFWEPISQTKAQIDLLVPTKVGQVIYASDTTLPGLCISTGTAAAQWRKMESATLGCGTNN